MEEPDRVTTIELFFDLVFVFTITQLTLGVTHDPTVTGVARSMIIFGNLWWMYGGYVWLTNTVPPTGDRERLLLLVGMGGFLVVALAIPSGFAGSGIALGVGYLIVNVVHAWLLLGRIEGSLLRAMGRLGPVNLGTASLILIAGFTPNTVTWILWVAAFVLHWATPYFTDPTVVSLRSGHFVERHGLIVLIALGESIFAVGANVGTGGVTVTELAAGVCGLVIAATMWWLYFDHDDAAARRAFETADGIRRSWLALHAYGYAFLPVLGGIIIFAAGLKRGIVVPTASAPTSTATLIAAGIATYAIGLTGVRARLRLGRARHAIGIALLALSTIPIGTHISSLVQLSLLGGLLVCACIIERLSLRHHESR
jgi:low temperature requirement protein LtrA